MNSVEIELVLQEILKEIQEIKTKEHKSNQNKAVEIGLTNLYQLINQDLKNSNQNILLAIQKKNIDIPKLNFTPIENFKNLLTEYEKLQSKELPVQIIKHHHSFKNWQWLAILFLFITLSFVLGWFALNNYYYSKDARIKYNFVKNEMPEHIHKLDSAYSVNPEWIEQLSKMDTIAFQKKVNKSKHQDK